MRNRRPSASRKGVNAAQSMQLSSWDAKTGIQSKDRPVRLNENAVVCTAITATSAQTPKMSARRRQVVKGGAGASTIGRNLEPASSCRYCSGLDGRGD